MYTLTLTANPLEHTSAAIYLDQKINAYMTDDSEAILGCSSRQEGGMVQLPGGASGGLGESEGKGSATMWSCRASCAFFLSSSSTAEQARRGLLLLLEGGLWWVETGGCWAWARPGSGRRAWKKGEGSWCGGRRLGCGGAGRARAEGERAGSGRGARRGRAETKSCGNMENLSCGYTDPTELEMGEPVL